MQAAALAGDGKSNAMSGDQHVNDVSGPSVIVKAMLQSTDSWMRMLGRSDMRNGTPYYHEPLNPDLNMGKISSFRSDPWDFRLSNPISMSHSCCPTSFGISRHHALAAPS